jgi:SOS-response transcriptional repressor LexA
MLTTSTLTRMPKKPLSAKPAHGQALVRRRDELGISQDDVEEITDGVVYKQLVYRLENGINKPDSLSYEQTLALAHALQWPVSKLNEVLGVKARVRPEFGDEVLDRHALAAQVLRLPVVLAGAGLPQWDDEHETVVIRVPETQHRDPSRLFCVRIVGESMRGYADPGATVVFDRDGEVEPGKVVAVHIPDDGLIVKRYYGIAESGLPLLGNDNREVQPNVFPAPDGAAIYGVAIGRWDPD